MASKKPPQSEADIQAEIVEALEKEGCLVLCLVLLAGRGFPDLTVMRGGKTVYIEVKKPGGVISPNQWRISELLFDKGFVVYFADDVSIVENVLRDLR